MPATSDDFLSGQGVPVELHDVETELTRLWGPAAEQAGGPEVDHPTVTRVALANLVVFGHAGESGRLSGVIDTVAEKHPSRTIVVSRTDAAERGVHAEISAVCHLPAPGMPQVCSERILLCGGASSTDLLPGAVRPLLEADLPFILWWTTDPRLDEGLIRDLGDECARLSLDLPDDADPAALKLGLDPAVCPYSRDTAWFGLGRWRELVAQFFDPRSTRRPGTGSTRSRSRPQPGRVTRPRLSVWLAAWLAGQLGWTPVGSPTRDGGHLSAQFQGRTE